MNTDYRKRFKHGRGGKKRELSTETLAQFSYHRDAKLPEHLDSDEFKELTHKINESADHWMYYQFATKQAKDLKAGKAKMDWLYLASLALNSYKQMNPNYE